MHTMQLEEQFEFKKNALSHIDRCFILGNGPTLNKFILKKLEKEFVVGVNKILLSGISPTILCGSDPIFLSNEYVNTINVSNSKIVFSKHVADEAVNKYGLHRDNIVSTPKLAFKTTYNSGLTKLWDGDFEETRCVGSVIGDLCIPLCVYLGIKKIFLLGVDEYWDVRNVKDGHFYSTKVDIKEKQYMEDHIMRIIRYAKYDLLASNQGCTIYNLSPGSSIKSFKKLDANKFFKDIVDKEILNISNKYVKIGADLFKVVKANNGIENACSLKRIYDSKYIRHYKGEIIVSDCELNKNKFDMDSSFYAERSFTRKDSVSFRSCNIENAYICKEILGNEYRLKSFDGDFIASDSSFNVFNCD